MIMSKFLKRLRKIKKNLCNCVVLGTGLGRLLEFAEGFNSVFILKTNQPLVKGKNIIYRENFKEISIITDIDFAFVDTDQLDKIDEIENLLNKCRPIIMINSGEFIDPNFSKKLRLMGYDIVELLKDYQIWNPRK